MRSIFKEYIFAVLAVLAFLIILIGAVIQSQFKAQKRHQAEICSSDNPTTNAICRYKAFTKGVGRK